ncbi:MAG: transposase [Planctomycetota bacterium]
MPAARPVIPGSTYHLTKRCVLRQFLLTPSEFVNELMAYCIAVAAERYGVRVHAACVMSNHQHQVVTDPLGALPEYMHWIDSQSAQCLNVYYDRSGPVWEDVQYRRITLSGEIETDGVSDPLESDDDILEKMIYTVTNPVAAGLVGKSEQWPGLCVGPDRAAATQRIERPKRYFKSTPPTADLNIVRPPCYQELSDEEFVDLVRGRTEERESQIREERRASGETFVGAKRVRKTCPTDSPKASSRERSKPEVAGKDQKRRLERKRRLIVWLETYRRALEEFQTNRDVEFPPGTYYMKKRFGVRVAEFIRSSKDEPKPPD